MKLTPAARMDDGQLDLLCIHDMSLLNRFRNFGKVYSGNYGHTGYFSSRRFREISIESDRELWIEADGELLGHTPCRIGVIGGAVRIRYRDTHPSYPLPASREGKIPRLRDRGGYFASLR
jgi:diacylglycerol kinase (ATP)